MKTTTIHLLKITALLSLVINVQKVSAQDTQGVPQRPEDFKPFIYKHSTPALKKYTKNHLKKATEAVESMDEMIFKGPYKSSFASLSAHQTPDWFKDAKFGIAFNYGIYSVAGHGGQGYGGNYYTDGYLDNIYRNDDKGDHFNKYWGRDFEKDDFIPLFTATELDAEKYIKLFKDSGAKYFVQFNMHRSTGMPLWDSEYTFRDPVDMPPFRDLTNEFVQACRKYGLYYGWYLNLEDTSYPLIMSDGSIHVREWTKMDNNPLSKNGSFEVTHEFDPEQDARRMQGKVPVYDYVDDYLLPLSKEFIDKYEPDYIWFDGGWKRPAWYYKSHKIVAYYYNKFHDKKEVMVNSRMGKDLYGKLGDVAISEGGQMDDANSSVVWEEGRPMGRNFAYDWRENDVNLPSSTDLIHMFIRIVANGGNLMLVVAPEGNGGIPDYQVSRLNDFGEWLAVNGEAIYSTQTHPWFCEESIFGRSVYYTQSKDQRYTYAICIDFENNDELLLSKARAMQGSEVRLLGYDKSVSWSNKPWGLTIDLPQELKDTNETDGGHAWVFRFEPSNASKEIYQQNE